MTSSTTPSPAPSDPGVSQAGHELIDAYASALIRGEGGDPADWLRGRPPRSRPGIAALRAVGLLLRYGDTTRRAQPRPGSSPDGPFTTPSRPLMSDAPDLGAGRSGESFYDVEWLRAQQLQALGLLDDVEGGMGAVELAWHLQLKREVVLKMAREDYLETRFHREIEIHAKLGGHPNIAVARTALSYRDVAVLVVDYVPGPSMKRQVESNGPLPWRETCDCVRQAAQGLGHAHARGVIHRDVKSSNLVRSATDGVVSVIDWGLALDLARLSSDERVTRVGRPLGTAHYCAPEQTDDARSASARSDLYGLGCTWFELLTGKPPFSGDREALRAAHAEAPVPPLPVALGVPEAVERVLRKLLAKDPLRRYASAEEFSQALDQAQPGAETPPRPPWNVWATASVVVFLLAAWHWWPSGTQPPAAPAIRDLVLKVVDPRGRPGRSGTIGLTNFQARAGDEITLEVDLTTAAYSYVIAFLPNGRTQLCVPRDEGTAPVRDRSPRYPPPGDLGSVIELSEQDGVGLQVFAVVVSRSPLPTFQDYQAQVGPPPWRGVQEIDPEVVWRADENTIEMLQPGTKISVRGAGAQSRGARGAVGAITDWLKSFPGVDAVCVKGFAVVPAQP